MKRSVALVISAAVTAFILVTVLAVSAPRPDPSAPAVGAEADAPTALTDDPAVLQQQLEDVYALLQQRESEYQQRLEEAYAQLQAMASDDEREDGGSRQYEFKGTVEAMTADVWTIGGRSVLVTPQSKVKHRIAVGDFVKVQVRVQEDGSLWVRELERKD